MYNWCLIINFSILWIIVIKYIINEIRYDIIYIFLVIFICYYLVVLFSSLDKVFIRFFNKFYSSRWFDGF